MIIADLGESSSFLQKATNDSSVIPSNVDPSFPSPHPAPCYEFEKYYDSVSKLHDANIPSRTGIDYLSNFDEMEEEEIVLREISSLANQNTDHIGLSVIDGARFEQRMTAEILTYFDDTTVAVFYPTETSEVQIPISITGSGSEYLSPSYASDSGNIFSLSGRTASVRAASDFTDLVILNETAPSVREVSGEEEFFAKLNTVYREQEEFTTVIYDDLGRESFRQSAAERVPDTSSSLEDIIFHENLRNEDYKHDFQKFVFSKFKKIIKTPFLGTEKFLGNTDFPEQEYEIRPDNRDDFLTLPNFLRSSDAAAQLTARAYVNKNFMAKVQYLQGFDYITLPDRPGYKSVLKPQWASLSLDEYRDNAGSNLLCRISPYERSDLGIRVANTGLPIYDAFFIIKPVRNPTIEAPSYRIVDVRETSTEETNLIANARTSLVDTYLSQREEAEGALVLSLLAARVALELFNMSRRTLKAEENLLRNGFTAREMYKIHEPNGRDRLRLGLDNRVVGYTFEYRAALRISGLTEQQVEIMEAELLSKPQEELLREWDINESPRYIDGDRDLAGDAPNIFRTTAVRNQVAERRPHVQNRLNEVDRVEKELQQLNRQLKNLGV